MWTPQEAEQVAGLLTQFNGADEVCAVMGCAKEDLDALCADAFGMDFERTKETHAARGRALVRRALFQQAMEGNVKALDMLAREQLGLGPVEARKKTLGADKKEEQHAGTGTLALLQGRRKDRLAGAAS